MDRIKLDRLGSRISHFLAVARCGNMHAVARQINLTQSALSRSIKKIEQTLGVQLFERTVAGTTLTKMGSIFLNHAAAVEGCLSDAAAALEEARSGELGQLRVAAGPVWLSVILPRVVARLRRHQRKPIITCVPSPRGDGVNGLISNEYDILCDRVDDPPSSIALVLAPKAKVDMCQVVSANHPPRWKIGGQGP